MCKHYFRYSLAVIYEALATKATLINSIDQRCHIKKVELGHIGTHIVHNFAVNICEPCA